MIHLTENKIAVQAITEPDRTESGLIIIPDEAKERSDQGIVKYIGPKVKDIQVGDYILFSGYTGTTIQMPGDEGVLIIFREEFVVAKLGEGGKGGFERTKVPGLYFREQSDWNRLEWLLSSYLPQLNPTELTELQKIVGKFMYDTFFPANYEQALQLCSDAVRETSFSKSIELKSRKKGDKNEQAQPDIGWEEMSPNL